MNKQLRLLLDNYSAASIAFSKSSRHDLTELRKKKVKAEIAIDTFFLVKKYGERDD